MTKCDYCEKKISRYETREEVKVIDNSEKEVSFDLCRGCYTEALKALFNFLTEKNPEPNKERLR